MSRRLVSSPSGPEVRQRGMVYQKGRKQSDAWVRDERAYGYFRIDVPGQAKQKEVRLALGFCRDKVSALLKLRDEMKAAGVLDVERIRERISPVITFRSQSAWWLAEMKAGRIVNKKTRKRIRPRTIDGYSTAVDYLNTVVGGSALASLDNPQAKELVARMKEEQAGEKPRFSDKTIGEYFKVFTQVVASVKDERAKHVFPREWDLAHIALPMVCPREQHRPTFEPEEIGFIVSNVKRPMYLLAACILAGTGIRIGELLALEIGKHISSDYTVLSIRQQRGKWAAVEPMPKTEAGFRDIDLCPALTEALKSYIGDRRSGFLFQTEKGGMLSPENFWRDGFATVVRNMGRDHVRFHAFRRFREAVLQASECRELLIDYWMGHANNEMGSRYARQLVENKKYRAEWSQKVGLGFDLAPNLPFAIRAIRFQEQEVAA